MALPTSDQAIHFKQRSKGFADIRLQQFQF